MLNIFAEALLIATRLGNSPEETLKRSAKRRAPHEFMEIEGLRTGEVLRNQGR